MKLRNKKIFAWLLVAAMLLTALPVYAAVDAQASSDGNVVATKTLVSQEPDEDGNYTIKLTVQGDPVTATHKVNADVVLVVDNSGSMASGVGRLCKTPSSEFIPGESYGCAVTHTPYTCPVCGARYLRSVGNDTGAVYCELPEVCLGQKGGKARLDSAKEIGKEFAEKILVEGSGNRLAVVGFSHDSYCGGAYDKGAIKVAQDLTTDLTAVNGKIDAMVAEGGTNYSAALQQAYEYLDGREDKCRPGYVIFISDGAPGLYGGDYYNLNWNGVAQTYKIRRNCYTMYTIGISLNPVEAGFLYGMSSWPHATHFANVLGDNYEYQLRHILNKWAACINTVPAGFYAKMTDVVNTEYFELVPGEYDGLIVEEDGKTLSWYIGVIPEQTIEVSFKVRALDGVHGEDLPTNASCELVYFSPDCEWEVIELPSPTVDIPADPETTDPETTDPETTDPETTDPETTDPETTDPETTDPETTDPETTDPETTDPETTDPETTDPETTDPETTDPETTDPETTDPETTDPETTDPETTDPETTDPETTDPETTDPETTDPETTDPETTKPETTDPKPTDKPTDPEPDSPATGDEMHLGLWAALVLVSVSGLVLLAGGKKFFHK